MRFSVLPWGVLFLPWGFWFCREVFCFCREVFGFAVMFLFLPWGFWFAVTVVGHHGHWGYFWSRDQSHLLVNKILVRTQTLVVFVGPWQGGQTWEVAVGLCLFVCLFFFGVFFARILSKRYSCTNSWTEVKQENDGGGTVMLLSLAPATLLSRWVIKVSPWFIFWR